MTKAKEEKTKKKIKLLWVSDGPTVGTGFGRVGYEIITRLLKTGRYEIVCLATNDRGEYHPMRGMKDLIIEPLPYISEDPYGQRKLPEILQKYNPDIVFSLNDIWVWTADERHRDQLHWFLKHLRKYKPYIPWVGYYCVDGRPWAPLWTDIVNNMTFGVVYSDYGYNVMTETPNMDMNKIRKIYHGSSCDKFFPLPKEKTLAKKNCPRPLTT